METDVAVETEVAVEVATDVETTVELTVVVEVPDDLVKATPATTARMMITTTRAATTCDTARVFLLVRNMRAPQFVEYIRCVNVFLQSYLIEALMQLQSIGFSSLL